jgi:predicted TIM-barrel fold metal-dependent hydrolase
LPSTSDSDSTRTGIVDVDFWPRKATIVDLAPYLSPSRRAWLRIDEARARAPLPESQYFVPGEHLEQAARAEDPQSLLRARLDDQGLERAIVNPGAASSVSGFNSAALADEFAHATNQWTVEHCLDADSRLLGSIVVTTRDGDRAAEEIRRAGADGRMAQVLLSYPQQLLGHRSLYPIYDAACELGLPVMLEAGGAYSGANGGITTVGQPASVFEALATWEFGAQPHLLNIVAQGVFDRFPELRLVLSGFGVAWLPSLLWRLDMEYRSRRVRPPASLARLPSEYVQEHVRFTTSVLEVPADPEQLVQLLSLVGGERLLLYGSGPLGGDEGRGFLDASDEEWAQGILAGNAIAHYARYRSHWGGIGQAKSLS